MLFICGSARHSGMWLARFILQQGNKKNESERIESMAAFARRKKKMRFSDKKKKAGSREQVTSMVM